MNLFYVTLSLLTIAFIFSLSLQVGEKSSQISFSALKWVLKIFKPITLKRMNKEASDNESYEKEVREAFHPFHEKLRKFAHMAEFGALAIFIHSATPLHEHIPLFYRVTSTLFFVLLTAVLDEFIQFFVPGRCSKVSDVLIDFAGAVLGLSFILLVNFILYRYGIIHV